MIYKGDTIPLTFTLDASAPKLFIAIGSADGRDLYAQFAYPAKDGYEPLVTTDNITFNGTLSASATAAVKTGLAVVEVKIFDADGNSVTGDSDHIEIKSSYLIDAN